MPIVLMESECRGAEREGRFMDSWNQGLRRQEGFSLKYSGNDTHMVWQPEEQVCCVLGGGRQWAGSQHPC